MVPDHLDKPTKASFSLYANLLDPSLNASTPGTISRAPIVFKQFVGDDPQDGASVSKQQLNAASLRFQPTKRPQLSTQKPKAKASSHKTSLYLNSSAKAADTGTPDDSSLTSRFYGKNTLANWTADLEASEEGGFYNAEKRQRGGRKKRKKNKEDSHTLQNWDDIYDPSRPNNYEEFKHSDERILELREWKDRLYAHRMSRRSSGDSESNDEHFEHRVNHDPEDDRISFAPPANNSKTHSLGSNNVPKDNTADAVQAPQIAHSLPGSLADQATNYLNIDQANPSNPLRGPAYFSPSKAEHLDEPIPLASTRSIAGNVMIPVISRGPVRYSLPSAPPELPETETEFESTLYEDENETQTTSGQAPRSLRPGQKGFAERLMSKYGWTKGSGLGASGSGIVNPLRVQVEKQMKKPDSEGGGFVGLGGKGKIVGGKKGDSSAQADTGKFGPMSEVVILLGMVDGMDLDVELEGAGEGGLVQEIGDECGDKYGRVERVYINRSSPYRSPVFVKFTSQLSALRAVNALEGRVFNGNTISARFFDSEKFEKGIYV